MADLHPVTNALPGTVGRGDTSSLEPSAVELTTLAGAIPVAAEADLGTTADLTTPTAHTASGALTAHTASGAIAATYADLPAARTSVNTLRTDVEAALGELDSGLDGLRSDVEAALDELDTGLATAVDEAEARLDDLEAKVDAILATLRTAGVLAA